jgi:hypothetical protein
MIVSRKNQRKFYFCQYTFFMSRIFFTFFLILTGIICINGQSAGTRLPAVDKSPMDMSYYPDNYPVLKIRDKATETLVARIVYSRPQKAGRIVFGELVEYGKVWRMGANEATEIEFFQHVKIGGKKIQKGRYTLYAIVTESKWTIIVNKDTDTWGSFKYDAKKDVVRTDVPVEKTTEITESLSMVFEKSATGGCNLIVAWDNVKVSIPVSI